MTGTREEVLLAPPHGALGPALHPDMWQGRNDIGPRSSVLGQGWAVQPTLQIWDHTDNHAGTHIRKPASTRRLISRGGAVSVGDGLASVVLLPGLSPRGPTGWGGARRRHLCGD